MLHFRERGGGSENGPRLSLGNGATSGPKVTCFTIYCLAGSHRLRARAAGMRESSTGRADPGHFSRPKGGPQDLAKNSKIHYRKPRFCVWITVRLVLSPATRGDGPLAAGCPRSYVNLQALRDPAPRIPDSVGISKKWRIKSYVVLQAWRGPAPRFPTCANPPQ